MIKKIIVKGIVQGVGFRPFVYRIAKNNNLKGYVKNMGNYVEIVVTGNKDDINSFLDDLMTKKPPLAQINEINVFDGLNKLNKFSNYDDFVIEKSQENNNNEEEGTIPPDIAICEDCLKEIMDKNDRRYRYPFTACTNCGARFTIVRELPYDRENTSMDEFPLCKDCLNEYKNPMDRRFHAQATCCPKCGPEVFLTDGDGNILYKKDDAVKNAVKLLKEGYILAIKGVGGTHLACCCDDDNVILNLRKRLNRPTQPFAVMTKYEYLSLFANFDDEELNLLKSPKRPIVVLEKNRDYDKYFSKYVSNLNSIGVMFPYSALHHLLFNETNKIAYIMTSANLPGLPMAIKNKDILNNLKDIADYFLLHNREIVNRCDDSVLKKINNRPIFLRRSRGYVPEPIIVNNNSAIKNNNKNILCVGAELNSTACLIKGNKFYLSQYIGNTSKYETFNYLNDAIKNLIKITNTKKIDAVVCDLHPSYNSTKLAYELSEKFGAELHKIQHHKAHSYSLMGDNDIFEDAIFIAIDGLGYGEDGTIWGGEVLKYNKNNNKNNNKNKNKMERIGHLEEQYQAGGDLATKYPLRMLLSILYKKLGNDELNRNELIEFIKGYNFFRDKDLKLMLFQLDKKINVVNTSSCGRILDSVSAMLSVCYERTYDGEYAIRLESVAENFIKKYPDDYKKCVEMVKNDIKIKNNILNTTDLVYNCYKMLLDGFKKEFIAYYIHLAIADGLSEIAIKNAENKGINYIGLTGGVSYNKIISERIRQNVENNGFEFLYHRRVPNGDGGISFGQGIGYILKKEE